MAAGESISRLVLRGTASVVLLSVLLLDAIWIADEVTRWRREAAQLREESLAGNGKQLKRETERVVAYIERLRSEREKRLTESIRARVLEAHAMATAVCSESRGRLDNAALGALVREALRHIRFHDGRGYYFATNLNGTEELFADRPDMEGRNLLDLRDTDGRPVIQDMIRIARQDGEGFYQYTWTKPGSTRRDHRKIAFVKRLEPLNWLIGTGEYPDYVEQDLQAEAVRYIESVRFGDDGYVFAGRWDGLSVAGPAKGQNMLAVTDPNGVQVVRELIRVAQSGGGLVRYVMPKIEGQRPLPKLSYAQGVPEWEWYVGAGMYVDDVEAVIAAQQHALRHRLRHQIWVVGLTGLAVTFCAAGLLVVFGRRFNREIGVFSAFFEQASAPEANSEIRLEDLRLAETRQLAQTANQMIRERLRIESLLRDSERKFRSVVNASPMGLLQYHLDERGRLVLVEANPAADAILRDDCQARLGLPIEDGLPLLAQDNCAGRCRRSATEGAFWQTECLAPDADGRQAAYELHGFPTGSGEMAVLVADVTARKQAEAARARLEEDLRQSSKLEAVGRLAGGVAHDFNNLLTSIIGFGELVLQQLDDGSAEPAGEVRYDVAEICRAAARAAELTGQLLAFSRRQMIAPRLLNVNESVRSMDRMLRRVIGEHIELVYHLDSALAPVLMDPGQVEQVIMNLAVNAAAAMPDGGSLTIETANDESGDRAEAPVALPPGAYVRLIVADTGHGMDEAVRERIFEPFFTTKGVGEGTGLGLATVYGIVKQNDGEIDCQSKPGEGTSFRIWLPRAAAVEAPVASIAAAPVVAAGSGTIMVVEDEEPVRSLVARVLTRYGYRAIVAGSADEAMALLEDEATPVRLLITDVVMPGLNGRDLADRVRLHWPHLPVLFISGYAADTLARHRVLEPGTELLPKPFTPSALAAAVERALARAGEADA